MLKWPLNLNISEYTVHASTNCVLLFLSTHRVRAAQVQVGLTLKLVDVDVSLSEFKRVKLRKPIRIGDRRVFLGFCEPSDTYDLKNQRH